MFILCNIFTFKYFVSVTNFWMFCSQRVLLLLVCTRYNHTVGRKSSVPGILFWIQMYSLQFYFYNITDNWI